MSEVTIQELRSRGGDVIDRVAAGERVIVTRSGRPIAEIRPLSSRRLTAVALPRRRRHLPPLSAQSLRADLDGSVDPRL